MENIKRVFVSIQFENEEIEIGELISKGKLIHFKYYQSFIKKGIEISPIKLKLNSILNIAPHNPFDGLFGVFADSLPDGWGKLLLDRALSSKGVDINNLSVLDRLSYVGSKGMGALIYRPEIINDSFAEINIELDEILKSSNDILKGNVSDVLDDLFILGGSSGGARPKILVAYNPKTEYLLSNVNEVPEGYEQWLIKFPSSFDRPDIANVEYAYYKMAIDAGLEMNESKLFKSKNGNVFFGTKRFDRNKKERVHLHSASGIMHDNFRMSMLDYGNIMDCAFKLENNSKAYEKILKIASFNVFAHNRDDHGKNISFLMNSNGIWSVAPAYDLTFSSSSHGMHSTMIAGESSNPTRKHLMELADYFKVKNAKQIIDQVVETVLNWDDYAAIANVSSKSAQIINKTLTQKYNN